MQKNQLESTNRLLKVIVALLLRLLNQRDQDSLTLREQIDVLNDLGLKPKEIAEILGRSNIYINKELSGLRKPRKQKG